MSARQYMISAGIGAVLAAGWVLIASSSGKRDCPDVYNMALTVEACRSGIKILCERLDTSISAKCLLDRSAEAEAQSTRDRIGPTYAPAEEILL